RSACPMTSKTWCISASPSKTVLELSILKGGLRAFKNFDYRALNSGRLDTARDVIERVGRLVAGRADDLLCVADHGQVGVVRNHDHFAPLLGRLDALDQLFEDGLVVQVFLGLVDDDRNVVLVHE